MVEKTSKKQEKAEIKTAVSKPAAGKQTQKEEKKIDTNLYSRQIGTFGMETMSKLIKMKVLIVGMKGLGVECAKNLILAGPHSVTLYDPHPVQWGDLSSNFYLSEKDVGAKISRAQASFTKLQELNPYVKVKVIDQLKLEDHRKYHVVCYTEVFNGDLDKVVQANEICRQHGIGFILTKTFGPAGFAFTDFGDEFVINDPDGEETKQTLIINATQSNPCIVTVDTNSKHGLQDGDHVVFKEVLGMTQLNSLPPTEVRVISSIGFELKIDATKFGAYIRNGLVENVKVPKKTTFSSLQSAMSNPNKCSRYGALETPDLRYFGRAEQTHFAILAYYEYVKVQKKYPILEEQKQVEDYVKFAHELNESFKKIEDHFYIDGEIETMIVLNIAKYASTCISPMAAFFGGITAQEIVKFTGKYSPLKQFLHYDIFETLPQEDEFNPVVRIPLGCRYDDQIKVYGREIQQKLNNVNTFMVGAGALGCEFIKAFALMGVGCSEDGSVAVTDNDNIEVSNLNRQFLFRKTNVGSSKSQVACDIAKSINSALNVKDYQTRVGTDTEVVFNDKFWDKLDFVVNAVDNIHARQYVDRRCVWYNKPLLESGTLGTKANTQMIIPFKTQCYNDSQDPPEEGVPMCTLRNFPSQIEHCIEWGRDLFNRLFVDVPADTVSYLQKPDDYASNLRKQSTTEGVIEALKNIKEMISLQKYAEFPKCIQLAKQHFDDFFDHDIQNLTHTFPENHKDNAGQPFWSGAKRFPTPQHFNKTDPLHIQFIIACANLIAYNLGLPQQSNQVEIAKQANKFKAAPFKPKNVHVELPGEESKQQQHVQQPPTQTAAKGAAGAKKEESKDDILIKNLSQQLKTESAKIKPADFHPAEFEKDNDANFHIDFINAAANLRARNYKIQECDQQKTKMIAGKIIPAIATTTAMITGCVTAEIYKFVQEIDNLETYKNAFINLALPVFVIQEPAEVNLIKSKDMDPIMLCQIKAIPEGHTIYDKIHVNGPLTVEDFMNQIKIRFNVDVSIIASGEAIIYNHYAAKNAHQNRRTRLLEDIYSEFTKLQLPQGRGYLPVEIQGVTLDDGIDVSLPVIKYKFIHE